MSAPQRAKTHQLSVRIARETDVWLEEKAGGSHQKAAFVRRLIERAREREREEALRRMFDRAAEDLGPEDHEDHEDHEEREQLAGAFEVDHVDEAKLERIDDSLRMMLHLD